MHHPVTFLHVFSCVCCTRPLSSIAYIQQLYSHAIVFNSFTYIILLFTLLFHLLTMQLHSSYAVRGTM